MSEVSPSQVGKYIFAIKKRIEVSLIWKYLIDLNWNNGYEGVS
jgi:hypothetical protein